MNWLTFIEAKLGSRASILKKSKYVHGGWFKRGRGEGEMGGFRREGDAQNLNRWIKF